MTDINSELPDHNPPSDEVAGILEGSKKIAIVGLSPKEERDSHKVAKYLMKMGMRLCR
jgi:predicted CoA-binding protein